VTDAICFQRFFRAMRKRASGACGNRLELPLQLPPRTQPVELQRPAVNRGLNRAARLAHVRAVPELALQRKRLDVLECGAEIAFPELKLAQAGSVDHHAAAGQLDELTVCGRVAPGSIGGDLTRQHHLFPGEPVQQRRLADA